MSSSLIIDPPNSFQNTTTHLSSPGKQGAGGAGGHNIQQSILYILETYWVMEILLKVVRLFAANKMLGDASSKVSRQNNWKGDTDTDYSQAQPFTST